MQRVPPLTVQFCDPYYVVLDATGRVLAQGSESLCKAVAAGQLGTCGGFEPQGSLFDGL